MSLRRSHAVMMEGEGVVRRRDEVGDEVGKLPGVMLLEDGARLDMAHRPLT